jgi:hypothetical protein
MPLPGLRDSLVRAWFAGCSCAGRPTPALGRPRATAIQSLCSRGRRGGLRRARDQSPAPFLITAAPLGLHRQPLPVALSHRSAPAHGRVRVSKETAQGGGCAETVLSSEARQAAGLGAFRLFQETR